MFSNYQLRSIVFSLAAVALVPSAFPVTSRAADDNSATVAILLPAQLYTDQDMCLEEAILNDAVAIIFNQNNNDDSRSILALEAGAFGDFGGEGLVPVAAKYITRGSIYKLAVFGLGSDLPPTRGAMLFDPNSDVIIEFCGYATANGSTLEEEFTPSLAEYLLVIVTGTVY